jgi:hypothetical protein
MTRVDIRPGRKGQNEAKSTEARQNFLRTSHVIIVYTLRGRRAIVCLCAWQKWRFCFDLCLVLCKSYELPVQRHVSPVGMRVMLDPYHDKDELT